MSNFSHPEVRALEAVLLYTPRNILRSHLKRLAELIAHIAPDRLYTYEYIFDRITRFTPDAKGSALLKGRGLQRDLAILLRNATQDCPFDGSTHGANLLSISDIASKHRVSLATVKRWGKQGLALCHYATEDGVVLLAAQSDAVEQFHARRASSSHTTERLSEEERQEILARASALRKKNTLSRPAFIRALVEMSGRSSATIRRLLTSSEAGAGKNRRRHARGKTDLPEADETRLIALYQSGAPVRALARQFNRSVSAVYRILHRALVERTSAMTIKYMPSPEFAEPDAEALCLGEEGLFTYPPEFQGDAPTPPKDIPPYLKDLYRIPLLDREHERFFFRKYNYIKYRMALLQEKIRTKGYRTRLLETFTEWAQAADQVQRILVRCNLRLVVSIAKRHVGPLITLFELVSEGNLCLMRAVRCYDYRREARLATYATWAISKHFARVVPENNYRFSAFVTGQQEMLSRLDDSRPNVQERVERQAYLRSILARASEHLTEREQTILTCHYGTDGQPAKTLEEIGGLFGVTRERIRQIEVRALNKLRGVIDPEAIEGLAL